jgi:hypothetical protein
VWGDLLHGGCWLDCKVGLSGLIKAGS